MKALSAPTNYARMGETCVTNGHHIFASVMLRHWPQARDWDKAWDVSGWTTFNVPRPPRGCLGALTGGGVCSTAVIIVMISDCAACQVDVPFPYYCPPIQKQLVMSTHWGRDNMAAISQMIYSNAFSWMKNFEARIIFHWNVFRMV